MIAQFLPSGVSAGTNVKDSNIRSLSIFSTNVFFYHSCGNYSKNVVSSIL